MVDQAGIPCKWASDSQRFLLEHFDTIKNSPSHIYHSALPFCPSSSWLHKCYRAELSQEVKVVKGAPAEWGKCSRTVTWDSYLRCLSCWNNTIAVGSEDGNITTLDAVTGSQTATFSGHTDEVSCLVFSSNGRSLVSGSDDKTVKLWDMQTGGVVKTFSGHTNWIYCVSMSPDSATIASGSEDKSIRLWNTHTGKCYNIIKQEDMIYRVKFSPTDPQHLLSICNRKVWQWNINGQQTGPTYDGHSIAFSPDGTQVVVCYTGSITVQNSSTGVTVTKLHMENGANPVNCCFSPDGKLVAASVQNLIHIWDITSSGPSLVKTFPGGAAYVSVLLFSSPSSLISVTSREFIKFWQISSSPMDLTEIDTGSTSLISSGGQLLTLQAKNGIIITSQNEVLKVWDISTCLCKASFQIPLIGFHKQDARVVNGQLITSWYYGEKVKLLDVEKGKLLWEADSHISICNIKISQDGTRVFCLYQGSLQALSAETGEVMGQVKFKSSGILAPSLTADGLRAWVHYPDSEPQGWNFGISDPSPIQLLDVSPHQYYLNSTLQWDPSLRGIKTGVTGKVIFWVPEKYGSIFDVQWNELCLVMCFNSKEVLVLDFSHIL